MTDTKINIGLIGYGYWGKKIYTNLNNVLPVSILAVCDNRYKTTKKDHFLSETTQITYDYTKVLSNSKINAVVVATPTPTHYKIARDALRAGKHVLLEKPMTLSFEQAKKLVKLARNKSLVFQIDHTYLFSDEIRYIQRLIRKKTLGKIFYFESIRTGPGKYQSDSNVLWDLGIHDASILFSLFGNPVYIKAAAQNIVSDEVYDIANIIFKYKNNITAQIFVSWLSPEKVRRLTIFGTKGAVVFNDVAVNKITLFRGNITNTSNAKINSQLINMSANKTIPRIKSHEPLFNLCNNFAQSIINKAQPISDAIMGTKIVKAIEIANSSAKQGGKAILYDKAGRSR